MIDASASRVRVRRARGASRVRGLTAFQLAGVFAVLTVLFAIFAANAIAPFGAESWQRLRASFSVGSHADYATQPEQRIAPQRPVGSNTGG